MITVNITSITEAVNILEHSGVVGVPTETVYGLAARIDRPDGIDKIFTTKERPDFDPLIVHVENIEQAKMCVNHWPAIAQKLAEAFWPGPLTMVLPKSKIISSKITSGLQSVGLRCPNHPIALELLKRSGPLAAPSANRFGKTSPTTKAHVMSEFNSEVFTLDGGACQVGIESTVVGVFDDRLEIYRPGMITPTILEQHSGIKVVLKESPVSPGALKHHYMPDIPLFVVNTTELPDELSKLKASLITLSSKPEIAARELYQKLREASNPKHDAIILQRLEGQNGEAWQGVWNRIEKAATKIFS